MSRRGLGGGLGFLPVARPPPPSGHRLRQAATAPRSPLRCAGIFSIWWYLVVAGNNLHRFPVTIPISKGTFILLLAAVSLVVISQPVHHTHAVKNKSAFENQPCTDSSYIRFCSSVQAHRLHLLFWYKTAPVKKPVLDSCRRYLYHCLADSVFSYWEHTPWDFYGTTEKPRCGQIACGYFVTTALRDLGFRIPRIRWAEVASETFIRQSTPGYVRIFAGKSTQEVVKSLPPGKENVYLAGLDNHVGFLLADSQFMFMHAYFAANGGVQMQPAVADNNPFAWSHYRAIGTLFTNEMLLGWLSGREWK